MSWTWWHVSIVPALGNGQEAQEFEVSIGNRGRSKSVWATGDFVSKEQKKGQNKSPKNTQFRSSI